MKDKKIIIGVVAIVIVIAIIVGIWYVMLPKENNNNTNTIKNEENTQNTDNNEVLPEEGENKDAKIKAAEAKIAELKSKEEPDYPLFTTLMEMDSATLKQSWNVDTNLLDAYVAKMPMMNVKANLYAILKPKEGKKEEIKEQVDNYLASYEEQWSTYLPDQHEMVKNRSFEEINGYLVYVISEDNEAVLNVVRQALK